ncbi:peptidoglycan editing factor PgeF [Acidiphilium sp.]|uniref:peptidoglycan editing factor PgeF n=1 Tax=Acidiphilium sp. TaxID=527 RepID=UPI003D02E053
MTPFLTGDLTVPHGFFTRVGGVSLGNYASLNCGLSGLDDPAHVAENRARAAHAIGSSLSSLLGVKQVHGARVITATTPWPMGIGPEADAIVTKNPNLALGIITADCAPVLFADPKRRIVGAAHAGWRGALAGVLEATAAAMRDIGAQTIHAVIGPCIHSSSYEVGADLYSAVIAQDSTNIRFLVAIADHHWLFDLPGYVASRLTLAGVTATILPHDTFSDEPRFFSHRRRTKRGEGPGGHQLSIITAAP